MNSKKISVIALLALVAGAFLFGLNLYQGRTAKDQQQAAQLQSDRLVRFHSPTLGPASAPVTLVEFFDPACEACRAFYPFVKDLMQQYPNDVRLVLRYAPFHPGSDQVIKLLEAAKRQDKFWPVLEKVLETQPKWADHGQPNADLAFQAAAEMGLDIQKAKADMADPSMDAVLQQDTADITALGVNKTPTFYVNGKTLPSFGPDALKALVAEEVAKAKQ